MATRQEVVQVWRKADAVCFDVDSTVCEGEVIDDLAKFCGVGKDVQMLTEMAMNEKTDFREMLHRRLALIKPSQSDLKQFLNAFPPKLTPGIQDLVRILKQRGVNVYLVSGGFYCAIKAVANILNIPKDHVFCNRLHFDFEGNYVGFDKNQLTSMSGGKRNVVSLLIQQFDYKNLVMIGDGSTDAEACPPAKAFIGFGGNVERPKIKEISKWYATSFEELIKEF